MRHGLTATQTMLPGEDPAEFAALRGACFSSLQPEGALENQLVERAASLFWRLRRVQGYEVALIEWMAHYQAQQYDDPVDLTPGALRNDPDDVTPHPDLRDSLTVGRTFEALLSADLTSKLSRYEASMQRQLSLTLKDLREMQRPRYEARIAEAKAKAEAMKPAKGKPHYAYPEDDPAYWAEIDRQRNLRMDPP